MGSPRDDLTRNGLAVKETRTSVQESGNLSVATTDMPRTIAENEKLKESNV